jgi:hypothetical protein
MSISVLYVLSVTILKQEDFSDLSVSCVTISQSMKIFLSCLSSEPYCHIIQSYLLVSMRRKFYSLLFVKQTAHVSIQCHHYLSLSCHSFVTGQLICATYDWHYIAEYCIKIVPNINKTFFLSRSKFSVIIQMDSL